MPGLWSSHMNQQESGIIWVLELFNQGPPRDSKSLPADDLECQCWRRLEAWWWADEQEQTCLEHVLYLFPHDMTQKWKRDRSEMKSNLDLEAPGMILRHCRHCEITAKIVHLQSSNMLKLSQTVLLVDCTNVPSLCFPPFRIFWVFPKRLQACIGNHWRYWDVLRHWTSAKTDGHAIQWSTLVDHVNPPSARSLDIPWRMFRRKCDQEACPLSMPPAPNVAAQVHFRYSWRMSSQETRSEFPGKTEAKSDCCVHFHCIVV